MAAQSGSGEGSLPGLQKATYSLCPHVAFLEREEESYLLLLFIRTLILSEQGLTLMTFFNLTVIPFLEAQSPNTATFRARASTNEFGGDINIQSIAGSVGVASVTRSPPGTLKRARSPQLPPGWAFDPGCKEGWALRCSLVIGLTVQFRCVKMSSLHLGRHH